jgi:hypothetical protein
MKIQRLANIADRINIGIRSERVDIHGDVPARPELDARILRERVFRTHADVVGQAAVRQ